jgi:hypothetical protein
MFKRITPEHCAILDRKEHVFLYATDRCVDKNGTEWAIMTWQPTYFVMNDAGAYQHVHYHHEAKVVVINENGKSYTGWSEEDKAFQREHYNYNQTRKPLVVYNARSWARVSTIPDDMTDRMIMLTYSDRCLRQALADDERMIDFEPAKVWTLPDEDHESDLDEETDDDEE